MVPRRNGGRVEALFATRAATGVRITIETTFDSGEKRIHLGDGIL